MLLWTVLTWSVFGGAITRIAAVQVARGEKIGLLEALHFTRKRLWSYVTAPLFPLLFILVVLVFAMILFGFPFMIPIFGDIFVAGLFWPLMIVVGLLMAITLVGLVGWPLMSATISARGHRQLGGRQPGLQLRLPEAVALHLVHAWWPSLYGAVVVFFVGFMGSLTVYLAKWGVSQTPAIGYVAGRERRKPASCSCTPRPRSAGATCCCKAPRWTATRSSIDGQINQDGLRQVGRPRRLVQRAGSAAVVEPDRRLPGGVWLGSRSC